MTYICCVPGCGENGKRILHSFPKNIDQSKKWMEATWCYFLNAATAWKTHYKVCRKHFQKTDFKNMNLLKKDVVPSLMLPNSITMEHDYCTRNSTILHAPVAEVNSLGGTINRSVVTLQNDFFSKEHIMEVVEERDEIVDLNGNEFLLENRDNGDECLLQDMVEANSILSLTDDQKPYIWKTYSTTNAQENVGGENYEVNSFAGAINESVIIRENDCISQDHVMEAVKESVGFNGNEFLLDNQVNGDECLLQGMGEANSILTDDQKPYISKKVSATKSSRTYNPKARKMRYLKERNKALAKKLKESQSANLKSNKKSKVKKKIDNILKTLSLELPRAQYDFIKLQLKNTGKSKNGNRFTFEEKTMALVIYKKNPKRYTDLRKISNLPTRQTLIAHSAGIRFKEGINQNLMDFIKKEVSQMGDLDRICTIGWDEMSLTSNLNFDQIKDYIDGFEDLGSKRTNNFATHGLVFMVRGVKSPYKQPISYFLTENLNSAELAELVRLVISAVMDTGLKVIGSVCDAVNINRAAVNKLIDPKCLRGKTAGELLEYTMNGVKIWHYFDPPHLIKSVRNNLLEKNLSHIVSFNEAKIRQNGTIVWNEKNKKQQTASWKDVQEFYVFNNDCETGLFNLIPNITEEHINPTRRKMKVNLATQVFSGTYGRNMYLCSKRKQFSNNCIGTAALLLFFNDLFDSVNGDDVPIPDKLIGSLSVESKHFTFWDYAIRMLNDMRFSENLKTGKPNQSYVFKHFVSTLKGLRRISEHLFEIGFESIGLRRLNQDGLENHFFKIRSYCGSNQKPNSRDFRNSYATSILNNQLSSHSLNANCEADKDTYMVQNLHTLFEQEDKSKNSSVSDLCNNRDELKSSEDPDYCDKNYLKVMSALKDEVDRSEVSYPGDEAQNCISGKICIQLLKKIKCNSCTDTVVTARNTKKEKCHDIMQKQSSVDEIVLPKVVFINYIKIIISKVQKMLPLLCAEKNLTKKLMSGLSFENNNDELIGCDLHRIEFVNEMKKITTKLTIERFTQRVNRILSGKVTVATEPIIEKKALEFRNKKKHIGKYVPPVPPAPIPPAPIPPVPVPTVPKIHKRKKH